MILHEFDSMESAMRWLASSERAAITAEARQIGRSSYTVQLWDDAS